MAEKFLSETDIKKLLQCSRCKRIPVGPPIYMCRTGHQECSVCYDKFMELGFVEELSGTTDVGNEYVPISVKHICAICKEDVTKTRNIFAESILHLFDAMDNDGKTDPAYMSSMKINVQETKVQANYVDCCYNIYGSPCSPYTDTTNMSLYTYHPQPYTSFPIQCTVPQYNFQMGSYIVPENQPQLEYTDPNAYYPENTVEQYNHQNRKELSERRSKLNAKSQSLFLAESSKRPIRCPTHLCGRNIAVAALSSHFCFDHPDIPPLNLDFDVSCNIFIDPDMIPFEYGRCVAIILIPIKYEPNSTMSQQSILGDSKLKNSIPLVVMASKLDCTQSGQPSISGIHEDIQRESLNHGDFESKGNKKSYMLVIWLAGVDMSSSLHTTIQVTQKETNMRSFLYTGPVMSLRASQCTSKIFEQGDCLIIHAGSLDNIVADKGGCDLHVMVH